MAGLPLMLNGAAGSANLAARPASCPNACMGFPHWRCKTGSSTTASRRRIASRRHFACDSASARPPSGSRCSRSRPAGRQHRWPHRSPGCSTDPHTTGWCTPQRGLLGGLHRDVAVAVDTGTGRDQLADDHVFLQTVELIAAAVDRRIGQHASGLLERRRRQPRVGGQRRLRDAHQHRTAGRGLTALGHHSAVLCLELRAVDQRARQNSVEPESMMVTRRSIWRTITSMCLSWIDTPWAR